MTVLIAVLVVFGMLVAVGTHGADSQNHSDLEPHHQDKPVKRDLGLSDSHESCPDCGGVLTYSHNNTRPESLIAFWYCLECKEDTCVTRS